MGESGRVFYVDVLSILFGLGTWLCVNGMWVELPLLVLHLPEKWNLPSYLSVLIQMSNIGPLLYTLLNSFFPKQVTEKRSIYAVMVLGLVTTILLANFWDRTTFIAGDNHSTALLVLVFFLASVDCSSRVLYLPFMSKFHEMYLISYFLGEGLSGLLPSIVALVQGVGGNPECHNTTSGEVEAISPDPRFSVDVFFYFLFLCTLVSLVSFYLLNKESLVRGARVRTDRTISTISTASTSTEGSLNNNYADISVFQPPYPNNLPSPSTEDDNNPGFDPVPVKGELVNSNESESVVLGLRQSSFLYLLGMQIFICFWANGVFPSVQSFSSLPYGNVAYHLAVTLSNISNPAVCLAAFFLPVPNRKSITAAAFASLVVAAYVMTTAVMSPSPPLMGKKGGEVLLILSWIILVALFTYVRVSIATILRTMGKSGLFWCGVVTQFGSAIGALVAFFVVNKTDLFKPYYPCPSSSW